MAIHTYAPTVTWTGNTGTGTSGYRDYSRSHRVEAANKSAAVLASSDPAFRGDPALWNPEELFVASLAQCHLLWYLHLAAQAGVVVHEYVDHAVGEMTETADGAGQFTSVTLRPQVVVADESQAATARALHDDVPAVCFLARSVNFPVRHEPTVTVRL